MAENQKRSKASIYFQAVRAFAFPASAIPAITGAMLAYMQDPNYVTWWLFPFILISVVLMQAASNVISDYDDYNIGVDTKESYGGSGVLTEDLLKPKEAFRFGIILFIIAFLFGLPIIIERGWIILLLGIFGILGGFFYTAKPVGYKYVALGDLMIFLLYGPSITGGTYYALTGLFSWNAVIIGIPLGLLVVGILHSNNFRDTIHDRKANIKTFASVIGENLSKAEYIFLISGAYLIIIALIIFKVLSPWSLLVLLSLPPAIKNINAIKGVHIEDTAKIAMLDVQTAQLTLMFGVLLSISLLITKLI
jgi:1,4-dihydroxy-2-naphthoate octaprenyltransferase